MRRWIIAAVLVVIVGGVIAATASRGGGPKYDLTYCEAATAPITMTIETNGTVEPLSTIQVGCEVTGKIIELAVDHDDPVKKDQIICRIDPELAKAEHEQSVADHLKAASAVADAKIALDEQRANLPVRTQQALAQLQEAQAALVDAEYTWKRVDGLYKNKDASEVEWVGRKAAFIKAQSAVIGAEAAHKTCQNNETWLPKRGEQAVAQAEAALQLADARKNFTATRVDRCTIRSPIDGVVLRRYLDAGTTVTAAFQTPVLFLLAPSLDRMRILAKVSESDVSHVEVGQTARFTVEARQPVQFEGKILHKRNQPDVIQNVVTYTVLVEVDNDKNHTLMPGLSVNVEIECVAKPSVAQIPNAALRFKPPISLEDRQALMAAATWPDKPVADATGKPADYCSKGWAWTFDESSHHWRAVPLWLGVTDNVNTEILIGGSNGERYVKKCVELESGGFKLKDALKLARPDNRTI
jgi:HlyD family secretion protein